jgi:hypothetical protein
MPGNYHIILGQKETRNMLILEVIIALVVLFAMALALVFQQRRFEKIAAQQEAWVRNQQSQLRTWESQQERRITNLETRLTEELQEVQRARQRWETKDAARMEELAKEYKSATEQARLQHELARILRIEDTPLITDQQGQSRPSIANWRPPMLYQANLRELDLSRRYLGYADLREAQLVGATLFMANLSGANLSGADLSNADLSGADLSNADLSDAILNGTNLLVADLHNANLTGANLLGTRNLTAQQLRFTTHDSTTLMDIDIDATPPRVEKVHIVSDMTSPQLETVSPVAPSIPITPVPESAEASNRPETSFSGDHHKSVLPPLPPLRSTPVSTEQEPAIPDPVASTVFESGSEPDTQQVEDSSSLLEADTALFIQHMTEPASLATHVEDVGPEVERSAEEELASIQPGAVASTQEADVPEPVAVTTPEADTQQVEELSSPYTDDTPLFIQHMTEPASVSSLTSGDSLLDPKVADILVDRQESKRTGRSDTASPRRKYNSKRAAKQD